MDKLSFDASGGATQVAFVVEDIEKEMEHWTRTLRVGPFFHLPHFPIVEARYRGAPMTLDFDVALAFSGTACFELIQQRGDTPSPFRETVSKRGFGFHHFGRFTRTFDADLRERTTSGMTLVASGSTAVGGRVAYLETASELGSMLELLEVIPPVAEFFGMIHAAAQSWDGKDPVRRLGG